ncbi:ABC transporter ATP-binding protein [Paenibacillus terrigena]|uniref:ABC transporter ATP-binding protein n=1 Tax=Paenibacillus terrigena TaxID=369333 RepID=UPI00035D4432|nr:ABC transporter ATP-binding protein [Paenibacillus terrigena]
MKEREIILDVQRLSISVQTERGITQAVQEVSFQIEAGKVLGIVGESGCGKSMTCMSILGLLPLSARMDHGSMKLRGQGLTDMTANQLRHIRGRELSLVLQNPMTAFNPALTIGKQFIETLRTHAKLSQQRAKEMAIDCLKQMNLAEPERILKQYPFELSGGMLQRIMIALSLSMKPSLIIADEPTTALDNVNRHHVMEAFRSIKAAGHTSILLVSHDLSVIAGLADHIIVMKDGLIVEQGDADRLMADPKHEYTKMLWDARLTVNSRNE